MVSEKQIMIFFSTRTLGHHNANEENVYKLSKLIERSFTHKVDNLRGKKRENINNKYD